ncbi:MFS transporter [Agromyces laixinhei]|uniref:MFS transporter n=1 Tax=Agromyces laixinhei TaxID=2585717 RepID=UPI0012EE5FBC|nr:MFS transporter [Agromyces laixinhei]
MADSNLPQTIETNGATQERVHPARIIAPIIIGNVLEWYDIILYTLLAVYISKTFFPTDDPTVSLMLTFGVFFVGYLIRPIGALVLGSYADRAGRKPALTLTLYLMAAGSVLLAIVPSYSAIGIAAPILVLLARLLQGFSAGGEYGTATALLVEHFRSRAGFIASFQYASQGLSNLLAGLVGFTLAATLTSDQISDWGFRIAFLSGGLVGLVAIYVRRSLPESPEFLAKKAEIKRESVWAPAVKLIRWHLGTLLLLILVQGFSATVNYTIAFMPTYAIDTFGLPATVGFTVAIIGACLQMVLYPISGKLSDRFGKVNQMLVGAIILGIIVYPLFGLVASLASMTGLIIVMVVLQVGFAWFAGPWSAVLTLVFPTERRSIGASFAYNCGIAIFGGVTPAMVTFLIAETGQKSAPAYWLIATAVMAVIALVFILRKYGKHVSRPDAEGAEDADVRVAEPSA